MRPIAAFCLVLLSLLTSATHAQTWPTKPIRLVVSYAPGGGADTTARLLAPKLSDLLGQAVIVENRAGSGGVIGGDAVAKASPDGYTFLLDASSHSINPALQPKMPFDTLKDLVPVSLVVRAPNVLLVHPPLTVSSVDDLIKQAKAKPGFFSYASAGNGSAQHLAGELFKSQSGVFMVHIPYRGGGPAMIDVMAGQIPVSFGNLASAMPNIKSGKLRALGITGSVRSPAAPSIPTIAESGLKGYEVYEWNAVFAPAGTPATIIERMNKELLKVLALADVKERLLALGAEPVGTTAAELDRVRKADLERWSAVIKRASIKPD